MNMIKDGRIVGTTAQYAKRLRRKHDSSLIHIIEDCKQAVAAMPNNPNNAYYRQEIELCNAELDRREESLWADLESRIV